MNKYKASALSHKGRSAILDEAKKQGVIIQRCKSNGEVLDEFVMVERITQTGNDLNKANDVTSNREIYAGADNERRRQLQREYNNMLSDLVDKLNDTKEVK